MKRTYLNIFLLQMLLLLVSCNKEDNLNADRADCVFEQIDEDMDGLRDDFEKSVMDATLANSLSSRLAIKANLIGEWELIGHVESWIPKISQPCAYITISKDELVFEYQDAHQDKVTTHPWDIDEFEVSGNQHFQLNVGAERIQGLDINQFSQNYMFGNTNVFDGNIYIYQKVQ